MRMNIIKRETTFNKWGKKIKLNEPIYRTFLSFFFSIFMWGFFFQYFYINIFFENECAESKRLSTLKERKYKTKQKKKKKNRYQLFPSSTNEEHMHNHITH